MPQIAAQASPDASAMDSLATGGGTPAAGTSPDQIRAKTEQAVAQIRELTSQLMELGKAIPGSEKEMQQIQQLLTRLKIKAAQAGATQNGSADALPS